MSRRVTVCLAACALWLSITITRASQVRPVNIEEMTARAATIFSGRCIDVDTVSDPVLGRAVSVAKFVVHRAVKGAAGRFVTVRMAADDDGERFEPDLPVFHKGDEVVLFLYGESALGLRSSVGLGQGRFKVASDKHGRPIALNGLGNRNLLRELSGTARVRLAPISDPGEGAEALDPGALLDMAEALVAGAR